MEITDMSEQNSLGIVGAEAGHAAILAYVNHDKCPRPATPKVQIPDTALADLLADLHHWADKNGINWDDQLRRANTYYVDERDVFSEKSA